MYSIRTGWLKVATERYLTEKYSAYVPKDCLRTVGWQMVHMALAGLMLQCQDSLSSFLLINNLVFTTAIII